MNNDEKSLEVKRLFEEFLDDNQFSVEVVKGRFTDHGYILPERHMFLSAVLQGIAHCVYGEIRKMDKDLFDVKSILFLGDN